MSGWMRVGNEGVNACVDEWVNVCVDEWVNM